MEQKTVRTSRRKYDAEFKKDVVKMIESGCAVSEVASNPNIDLLDSATLKLEAGFKTINKYSGSFVEYKLLRKRLLKDDIATFSYLVKFKKKFYRYVFMFYKAREKIVIYKFSYDDALDIELEESLKLYRIDAQDD